MIKYITAALIAMSSPVMAGVDYDEVTRTMTITGQTTAFTSASVFMTLAKNDVDTVYMYGPGGSYYDGLKIGRMLKKEGVRVIIPSDKDCISACAFAAMGADNILSDGRMLYHKPYTLAVPAHSTIDQIASTYGVAYIDLAEYVVEMGYDMKFARDIVESTNYCTFYVIKDDFSKREIEDKCD